MSPTRSRCFARSLACTRASNCSRVARSRTGFARARPTTPAAAASLEDDLSEFSSYDRMSVDVSDLIYGVWKDMHPGGVYTKGHGREALGYVKGSFASALWLPLEIDNELGHVRY